MASAQGMQIAWCTAGPSVFPEALLMSISRFHMRPLKQGFVGLSGSAQICGIHKTGPLAPNCCPPAAHQWGSQLQARPHCTLPCLNPMQVEQWQREPLNNTSIPTFAWSVPTRQACQHSETAGRHTTHVVAAIILPSTKTFPLQAP